MGALRYIKYYYSMNFKQLSHITREHLPSSQPLQPSGSFTSAKAALLCTAVLRLHWACHQKPEHCFIIWVFIWVIIKNAFFFLMNQDLVYDPLWDFLLAIKPASGTTELQPKVLLGPSFAEGLPHASSVPTSICSLNYVGVMWVGDQPKSTRQLTEYVALQNGWCQLSSWWLNQSPHSTTLYRWVIIADKIL